MNQRQASRERALLQSPPVSVLMQPARIEMLKIFSVSKRKGMKINNLPASWISTAEHLRWVPLILEDQHAGDVIVVNYERGVVNQVNRWLLEIAVLVLDQAILHPEFIWYTQLTIYSELTIIINLGRCIPGHVGNVHIFYEKITQMYGHRVRTWECWLI